MFRFILVFLSAFILSILAVTAVYISPFSGAFKDTELACVQRELKRYGTFKGPVDGVLSHELVEAARQIKTDYRDVDLPHLVDLNKPSIWCDHLIALADDYEGTVERVSVGESTKLEADIYIQCVERQLSHLGYFTGAPDGISDQRFVDALTVFTKNRVGLNISKSSPHNYQRWCQEIGVLQPETKQFWPTKEGLETRLTLKSDNRTRTQQAAENAYHEARDYFVHYYDVDIHTPVGISVAKDGDDAIRMINALLKRQNRSIDQSAQRWINRCKRSKDNPDSVDGFVYVHTMLLCGVNLNGDKENDRRVRAGLISTMVHEYVHLLQGDLSKEGPKSKQTTYVSAKAHGWLVEGSATYLTSRYEQRAQVPYWTQKNLQRWVQKNNSLELRSLAGRNTVKAYKNYRLAELGIHYLVEQSGEQALFDYFRNLGKGHGSEGAFKLAFGISTEQFYRKFENGFRGVR